MFPGVNGSDRESARPAGDSTQTGSYYSRCMPHITNQTPTRCPFIQMPSVDGMLGPSLSPNVFRRLRLPLALPWATGRLSRSVNPSRRALHLDNEPAAEERDEAGDLVKRRDTRRALDARDALLVHVEQLPDLGPRAFRIPRRIRPSC